MVLAKAKKFFSNVVLLSAGKDVGGFGRKVLELPLPGRAGLKLFLAAGAFSQVNWQVNQLMLKQALELAKPKSSERICDLYAGAGNFSLPFAASGAKVIAVECEPRLVAMGRQSAERYRLDIEYVESSVEKFLAQRGAQLNADLVIADPPRSGLGELVKSINLAPRMILISCHLPSLVRDLHDLIEVGWRVELVQPFDMFAQTTYLEILVLLERS